MGNHLENAVEQRFRETLAPGPRLTQQLGDLQRKIVRFQFSIAQQPAMQVVGAEPVANLGIEGLVEPFKVFRCQGEADRHRMAAEMIDQSRLVSCHCRQRVAQMHAFHRATGSLQLTVAIRREHDHWSMQAVFQTTGNDPDHSWMPIRVEQTQPERKLADIHSQTIHAVESLGLHPRRDVVTLPVDRIQSVSGDASSVRIVIEQAFDPLAHVFQPTGGIESRSQIKSDIAGGQALLVPARHRAQGGDAGYALALANAPQTLFDQNAVEMVQRYHVSDRTERDQIEKLGHVR